MRRASACLYNIQFIYIRLVGAALCAICSVRPRVCRLCIAAVLAVLPDVTLVTAMINVLHHSDQHNLDV